jgi:hypothetical protein
MKQGTFENNHIIITVYPIHSLFDHYKHKISHQQSYTYHTYDTDQNNQSVFRMQRRFDHEKYKMSCLPTTHTTSTFYPNCPTSCTKYDTVSLPVPHDIESQTEML